MAIDTRNKRASAVCQLVPAAFPAPDAVIDAGDRKQMAGLYRTTDGGGPTTAVIMRTWKIGYPG